MAITFSGVTFSGGYQIDPTFVPNAPTIGTATQTGSTTATVAFTAPSYGGSTTITTYTATSSPGGITGTLSQAGSGTITVTGLTASTSYTFTVTATNTNGTSVASSASNSITTTSGAPTTIGQSYGGGYYAGQISTAGNGVADYYLVVGPVASAQNASLQWKTTNTATAGTSSVIDGPTNSNNMNNASHPAAQFCKAVNAGGYTDWYMPAVNELEVCYYNLKPTTQSNTTLSAINNNAVPARPSNYTTGTPAQTSASIFQTGQAEVFTTYYYWSSTSYSAGYSWSQTFQYGRQHPYRTKDNPTLVRAIRRVAV